MLTKSSSIRFKTTVFSLLTCFSLLNIQSVNSADKDGKFAALGAGVATCERYINARNEQSTEFFLFGGWIDGYISARNQLDTDTYTLAPWQTIDVLAGFVTDYCTKHPSKAFMRAVMIMTEALKKQKLTTSSPRMVVRVGDRHQEFFKETIIQMQQILKENAYYKASVTGEFNPDTQKAIKEYQQANQILATGFPDQITLFTLFNR